VLTTDLMNSNLSPFREARYIRRPVINLLTILRRLALQPVTGQCLAAGLMFGLSFPCHPDHPLSSLFHPAWAWIALAPLLVALTTAPTAASAFRRGWTTGLIGNLICLYWVGYTQGGGPAVIAGAGLGAAYLALFTGLFAVVQYRLILSIGCRGLLAAPVLWTAMEYLLSLGEMGFPWLLLGHSQASVPPLIQMASITGVYGISWVIVLVSAFVALALVDAPRRILSFGAAVLVIVTLFVSGWWTLKVGPTDPAEQVRVGLIQNNLGRAKWQSGGLRTSLSSLDSLSRRALGWQDDTGGSVDLLVWPETAVPCDLSRRASCRRPIQSLADEFDVPVLTGAPGRDAVSGEPLNAVYFVQPHTNALPTYAKMHLVPFGERTPYLDTLPLLRRIDWTALTGDLAPAQFARGRERTLFPLQAGSQVPQVGPLVCFESVFPDLVRQHVVAGADILVIITNDSWFGASSGPFQHAQIAALRAVENRRPIARCATNGVSLFIDAYGRSTGHTQFGTTAISVGTVALQAAGTTFYTRHGDWLAQLCLFLTLATFAIMRFYTPTNKTDPTGHDVSPMTDDTLVPQADSADTPSAPIREMPFLDHLEELRWRLLKGIGALLVGAVICFAYADPLLQLLTQPYEQAVVSLQQQNSPGPAEAIRLWVAELRLRLSEDPPIPPPDAVPGIAGEAASQEPATQAIPYRRQLQSLRVMTWFIVSLQVALLGGLIIASPIVFYQLWRFIAPGLLSRERRLVFPIISLSVICFLLGAAVAYYIVLPLGLRFFLSLEPADMVSQWAVDEYIGFVLRLLLGFGVVFEMPVVSLFLSRIGLLTPDYLRRIRRYAIVGIFLTAAVFTPPDPISQLLMALPLLLLYEISIGISHLSQPRRRPFDTDPETDPEPAPEADQSSVPDAESASSDSAQTEAEDEPDTLRD
jgi:apolipoprotein N-acyltransferase